MSRTPETLYCVCGEKPVTYREDIDFVSTSCGMDGNEPNLHSFRMVGLTKDQSIRRWNQLMRVLEGSKIVPDL